VHLSRLENGSVQGALESASDCLPEREAPGGGAAAPRRLRIAFFTEVCDPQVNGVSVTLRRVTEYLRACGHEVLLIVPRCRSTRGRADFVRLKCIPLPLYPEMPVILPHWCFHQEEFARVETFDPDLVHVWTPGVMSFFGQKWARSRNRPVVASYETDMIRYAHCYGFGRFESSIWRYLQWLYNNCQRTFVPSDDTKAFLESGGVCNVEVFGRGVDSVLFSHKKRAPERRLALGVDSAGVLILYVGRLAKEKNLPLLMRSFQRLYERHPHCRLAIVGEGPLQGQLARKFAHPGISFLGVKRGEELAAIFASADIFASPSATETLSLASLEAMASGLAVLGMNSGGVRTIVKDHETGMLANSDNEFSSLLQDLATIGSLRQALSRNARAFAEGQAWDGGLTALERSYQEVVCGVRRAS
jgi:phosphatidylinositol alpha 1,6-mannosyltransferase